MWLVEEAIFEADGAQVLQTHQKELHLLANALIKYETLTEKDIRRVIEGQEPEFVQS